MTHKNLELNLNIKISYLKIINLYIIIDFINYKLFLNKKFRYIFNYQ